MIPTRRNIDTDELIFLLDPSSPLSFKKTPSVTSVAAKGKNQFSGTKDFFNGGTSYARPWVWSGSNGSPVDCTIVPQTTPLAPNGLAEAVMLTENAGNTSAKGIQMRIEVAPSTSSNDSIITHSLYVKESGVGTSRNIRISHNNSPGNGIIIFDFATNTIIQSTSVIDSGSIDVGNGWYRIWYTSKINSTNPFSNTARSWIYLVEQPNNISYNGDGVSGVLIWGPQWENGTLSNYIERPNAASNLEYFQYNTFRQTNGSSYVNPKPYTTTFNGTNILFNGIAAGIYGGADQRTAFNPGPTVNSLTNHSGFAWVNVDTTGDPRLGDSWPEPVKVYTIIGMIGGRQNNGVFGINETGTRLIYKVRQMSGSSIWGTVYKSPSFNDISNNWHFISFTYDILNQTTNFYLDGVFLGAANTGAGGPYAYINGGTAAPSIGFFSKQNAPRVAGQYKGLMNLVGFYNKGLSEEEHKDLYDATKYRFV